MAKQPVLTAITSPYGSKEALNNNFASIETAFDNTLSRDGSSPNNMEADLDLDSNNILNVGTLEADEINLAGVNLSPLTSAAADVEAARVAAEAAADEANASAIAAMAAQATMLKPRGAWVTATAYSLGDVVYVSVASDATNGGASYYATVAHTSGATFAGDLATKWGLVSARGATGEGTGDMLKTENLSGLANYTTARNNMGLGSLAVQNSGTVTITGGSISGITDLAVADGGTGASTPAGARTNLEVVPGTHVQTQDPDLQGIADATWTAGGMLFKNGTSVITNLPIGTTGQVVTVVGGAPAWATPSGPTLDTIERLTPGTTVRVSVDAVVSIGTGLTVTIMQFNILQVGSVRVSSTFRNAGSSADASYRVRRTRNGSTTTLFTSTVTQSGTAITETYDASVLPGDVLIVEGRNTDTGTAEFTNTRVQTNGENIWHSGPPTGSAGAITISNTFT